MINEWNLLCFYQQRTQCHIYTTRLKNVWQKIYIIFFPSKFWKFQFLFFTKHFCITIPSQSVSTLWNPACLLLQCALSAPSWQGLVLLTIKYELVMKVHKKPQTWTDSLDKWPNRKKMDMRFGTWNVRSMYRSGLLRAVMQEITKYKLDLVGVQVVRLREVALNQQVNIHFSMERGMRITN
jgi:hypothetical protein